MPTLWVSPSKTPGIFNLICLLVIVIGFPLVEFLWSNSSFLHVALSFLWSLGGCCGRKLPLLELGIFMLVWDETDGQECTSDFPMGLEFPPSDCFTTRPPVGVSVHSGCYNKILQTELLINKHLFFWVLEASSLRSGCQPAWLDEGPISGCRLLVSSHDGRGGRHFWSLFYKGINPIHEGSNLMT